VPYYPAGGRGNATAQGLLKVPHTSIPPFIVKPRRRNTFVSNRHYLESPFSWVLRHLGPT
jgi:hypothetical protein